METSRFFLALIPPEPVYTTVQKLKEHMRNRYGSKGSLKSPPHITLHMPFDWPEKKTGKLIDGIQKLAMGWPAAQITLNGFGHFDDRVLFIKVELSEQLIKLQQSIRTAFRTDFHLLNDRYRDQPFHPHMTVGFRDLKPAAFREAWQELGEKEFRADFPASELTLLKHTNGMWTAFQNFPLHTDPLL